MLLASAMADRWASVSTFFDARLGILLSKLLHRQFVGSLHGKVLMVGSRRSVSSVAWIRRTAWRLSVPEHRLFASGQRNRSQTSFLRQVGGGGRWHAACDTGKAP
jgi:hypothetical protein